MLSENIAALRQHLLKYVDCGVTLAPGAVSAVTDLLLQMTLDAAALEQSRIAPLAKVAGDLPANVVRLRRSENLGGAA